VERIAAGCILVMLPAMTSALVLAMGVHSMP
jgi:hypothetical protein